MFSCLCTLIISTVTFLTHHSHTHKHTHLVFFPPHTHTHTQEGGAVLSITFSFFFLGTPHTEIHPGERGYALTLL